jgi:Cu/Ag efflux pump CusA
VPAFVSTLAICIVFVPVLLLTGPAKFLFTPLALAVVFAMMMSYFLSRTIVPTMMHSCCGRRWISTPVVKKVWRTPRA